MRTDKFNYDDKRYSEQAMQAIKLNRNSQIYPKSLQNFDNGRTKALANQNQAEHILDKDVSDWLSHQDNETKRYINDMIRLTMTRLPQLSRTIQT